MEQWQEELHAQKHRIDSLTDQNIQKGYYHNAEFSQEDLEKAAINGEIEVYTEDALNAFATTLKKAMNDGEIGGQKIDSKEIAQKAQADLSKLINVNMVKSDGVKSPVWVKMVDDIEKARQGLVKKVITQFKRTQANCVGEGWRKAEGNQNSKTKNQGS